MLTAAICRSHGVHRTVTSAGLWQTARVVVERPILDVIP